MQPHCARSSLTLRGFTVFLACAFVASVGVQAQQPTRIFRCGNTYTNDAAEAQAKSCKLMEGGNITVVEGTRVSNPAPASGPVRVAAASPSAPATGNGGTRVDAGEQRARDADARQILESELKKAEARQAELLKEFNNGEPERRGDERNYQKYLERVAELKSSIARNDSDIAGIRRELGRVSR